MGQYLPTEQKSIFTKLLVAVKPEKVWDGNKKGGNYAIRYMANKGSAVYEPFLAGGNAGARFSIATCAGSIAQNFNQDALWRRR